MSVTSEPPVLVHRAGAHDAVCVITLNRPAALNSFTAALHAQLLPALEAAAADRGVRAVLITGQGRGFCAGQDLTDAAMVAQPDGGPVDVGAVIDTHYRPLALRLRSMPVPVVMAVNGVAAGAGASLALCGDLVVAARSASFVQAFSKIGLVPDCGGTWLLPRLVGRAKALGLALLGDKLPAEEAERLGLIWQVVDDVALMPSALALCERLAAMPTRALVATRQALDEAAGLDFPQALTLEATVQRELGRGADFVEGVSAFFARRPPVFRDR